VPLRCAGSLSPLLCTGGSSFRHCGQPTLAACSRIRLMHLWYMWLLGSETASADVMQKEQMGHLAAPSSGYS
jgi:hypothetical protein